MFWLFLVRRVVFKYLIIYLSAIREHLNAFGWQEQIPFT
jgi:hypothetical protein